MGSPDKKERKEKKLKKEKKDKTAEAAQQPAQQAGPAPADQSEPETAVARKVVLAPIAKPLADEKLCRKVLKLAKKAAKRKQIKRGVKEVVKAIRKGAKGVCLLAGDISPIDVITPLPVLCEEHDVPYIYVPSKDELGQAGLTKRPTSCMLVLPKPQKAAAGTTADDAEAKEFAEAYAEAEKKVKAAQIIF